MLTIILGIILSAIFLWISEIVKDRGLRQMFSIFAGTVFMVSAFYGIWSQLSGYNEWKIEGIHDTSEANVVKVYERRGKMSIWTFAFGTKETKYVICIPEVTSAEE